MFKFRKYALDMKAHLIELASHQSDAVTVKKIETNHFNAPFHFHDYCELNYVKKSNGKRIVGDCINNFSEGDLVLMSPNLPHVWYNESQAVKTSSSTCSQAIVTYFPLDFLDKISSDKILLSKKKHLFEKAKRGLQFHGKTQKVVIKHLESMANKTGLPQLIEFLEVINLLIHSKEYEPLASIDYNHSYNQKETERMNLVYKYVINNFAGQITLNTISSIANMTPPAFCSFFKMRTQMSFTRFLNEIRIGHACKLLQNLELPISVVCYNSGYQNFTNFNKFFKKIVGKTPSEYRNEFKN